MGSAAEHVEDTASTASPPRHLHHIPSVLRVVCTNACSVANKLVEMEELLGSAEIAAITETWLTEAHGDGLLPDGFIPYRCDRPNSQGGGCLLLVKDSLRQRPVEDLFCSRNVQIVGCVLDTANYPILIICAYRSPIADELESSCMLQAIAQRASAFDHCLVLGDFNAPTVDWVHESVEGGLSFASSLLEISHELALHQLVREPTRLREGQSPSILDLVFCRYENDVSSLCFFPPLGKSDHVVLKF